MNEKKYAIAYLKALRVSPIKLSKLTRVLTGLSVSKAMARLSFCNLKTAPALKNLLKSAMTNAENNHGLDIDKLVVHRIDTGKAFAVKRFMARARGRGARISKPSSHVRIILTEMEEK
ncbi:MAG: 50S ribosomal protein L22 [Rickettsiales bacterium]|jgi:large subunit ribosomal protein L22|nr:50S ribosomal protein L22 [Rickettsiales bacterium]